MGGGPSSGMHPTRPGSIHSNIINTSNKRASINRCNYGYTKTSTDSLLSKHNTSSDFFKITTNQVDIRDLHSCLDFYLTYNLISTRVTICSKFNLPLWYSLLNKYVDQNIVQFLAFGFPLDVKDKANFRPNLLVRNHQSALRFKEAVAGFLQTETLEGAILGPFNYPPIHNLHCSPLLTRPKGPGKRRVIVNMSWPIGYSVNDHVQTNSYLNETFDLHLPTLDLLVDRIVALKGKCKLFKIDLSRAFRQLPLDPADIKFTGLFWLGNWYIDLYTPFGYRNGTLFCQRVTDAIRHIMNNLGYYLLNYVDDLIGCEIPRVVYDAYNCLLELLQALGLPISIEKLCIPQTEVPCLGILVNIVKYSLSLTTEKLVEVKHKCHRYYIRDFVTRNELQSLIGSLIYIGKCVKPARLFVNRILTVLRLSPEVGTIFIGGEVRKDLAWFNLFLKEFNGSVSFKKHIVNTKIRLFVDASLTGLGGCHDNRVYASSTSLILDHHQFSIVHFEMINVLLALRLWGADLADSSIIIMCDNLAVVQVLNSGRGRDAILLAVSRNIWLELALHNIDLEMQHVPGTENVTADLLSRWAQKASPHLLLRKLVSAPQWYTPTTQHVLLNHSI